MVTPATGSVVLVPFPFSDLSRAKLRPAVVLADAGRGDWILAQVTSKPYGDPRALPLADADFESGSLRTASYLRPGKIFTADQSLLVAEVGTLKQERFRDIMTAVISVLDPARSARPATIGAANFALHPAAGALRSQKRLRFQSGARRG